MDHTRAIILSLVLEVNDDGYLASVLGLQGAFAEGDTVEEAIFNCIDVVKMIATYRAERGESLGFNEIEFTPDTRMTMAIPVKDLFTVQDKVVIVTGGLGQLGRQFSLALLDRGAKVAIFDLQVDERRVAERFGRRHTEDNLLFMPVDVTQRSSIEAGLSQVNKMWGVPHALINNAALDSPPNAPAEENGPFESYPESSWDKVMEVNVKGVFLCCQVVGGKWPQPTVVPSLTFAP